MNDFITLYLKDCVTCKTVTFAYNINILSHIVKSMIDDLKNFIKPNHQYDLWLDWTNVPPIDYKKWCLQIEVSEKDSLIHHTYNLYLQTSEVMDHLEKMLLTLVNDSEIDFTKNLVWEVLTW